MTPIRCRAVPTAAAFVALFAAQFAAQVRAQEPALRGFDPIALAKGKQESGKAEFATEHGGYRYRFASAEARDAFAREPERWSIQLGGACARMGPLSGAGDPQRWLVHKERIYVFASDQCRDRFAKGPDAFLAVDEPPPADAAALAAGQALLQRAVAAHGGAERLRAWRTWRHERTTKNGDLTEQHRVQLAVPDSARIDHDYVGHANWSYSRVVSPAASFFVESGATRAMGADAQREVRRTLLCEPLLALRLALDGRATVAAAGKRDGAGGAQQELAVWCDGGLVTFGIGSDGCVRSARCRGRGPGASFGALELAFDDWQETGELRAPATIRATFDGVAAPELGERRTNLAVDVDLPAATFAAPK
jgi:YHS domain-containing protein